jgi:hypothetical protein
MKHIQRRSECRLHGDEGREPWGADVVEMYLVAGREELPYRSHHIHFVRDGLREVHVLDEHLSPEGVERIWAAAVAAMERGDQPRTHEAQFHHQRGSA